MAVEQYIASTYGDRLAEVYDDWFDSYDQASIEKLERLAEGGAALELGIGTGRLALPLAARGVKVHGIDASAAMVARLRARPGGDAIPVSIGDFADVAVAEEFSLIYVAFNTFFALLTQAEQVRCFRNVASHLVSNGKFVIEAFVPDPARFAGGHRLTVQGLNTRQLRFQISQHDSASQRVKSQNVVLGNGEVTLYPVEVRYAWPSELDLMAQLAGLRLRDRWESWTEREFTSKSESHISVYERLPSAPG
jgi:SAM-dependent methyltransferase